MSEIHELTYYVDRLMQAGDDGAYIIIHICGTDDFLQLTGDAQGVQIDFPLITDRQISNESKIYLSAESEKLPVVLNQGGNGARFLDVDVDGDPIEVARVCRVFLGDVFGVNEDTQLDFETKGLY